jgi:hypothetical protein
MAVDPYFVTQMCLKLLLLLLLLLLLVLLLPGWGIPSCCPR